MTGQSVDEALGDGWLERVFDSDRTLASRRERLELHPHEPSALTYRVRTVDDGTRWVRDQGRPCFDHSTTTKHAFDGEAIELARLFAGHAGAVGQR